MLWIPEGFAHGFLTLMDNTIFQYKCIGWRCAVNIIALANIPAGCFNGYGRRTAFTYPQNNVGLPRFNGCADDRLDSSPKDGDIDYVHLIALEACLQVTGECLGAVLCAPPEGHKTCYQNAHSVASVTGQIHYSVLPDMETANGCWAVVVIWDPNLLHKGSYPDQFRSCPSG